MHFLLDACVIAAAFDVSNQEHIKFRPLLLCLKNVSSTKMVYGGSKYKRELYQLKNKKYTGPLAELKRAGKILVIDDALVDDQAARLKEIIPAAEFNDEHLVSIVIIAGCRLVATSDEIAIKYLKQKALYPPRIKVPKIYQRLEHQSLCPKN